MRRLLPLVLALALPSPAAADTTIATVDRPTMLSAYGTGLLFSRRDTRTDTYRLWYAKRGSAPVALPIRPRAVPFDADLGPGTRRHRMAVYSRCASEPDFDPEDSQSPPDYSVGAGCDLYAFDITTGHERRLAVSSPTASEVLPTIWGNTVAFVRDARTLVVRSGLEPPRSLAAGPADGTPEGLDLRGHFLAFGWSYPSAEADGPASDLRVDDIRTGALRRRIDTFRGGGLTTIALAAPAFEGRRLYWARLCQGDPGGCGGRTGLDRATLAGRVQRTHIGPEDLWQTRGGGVTYVLHDANPFRSCFDPEGDAGVPTCSIIAKAPSYR